jgi:methanethiol S-methyltransferase
MRSAEREAPLSAYLVAWGGTLLFFASLAYFLFSYVVSFGDPAPRPSRAGPIAVDTLLFTVFALHHSIFARERVRAAVARLVRPELERSVYVWLASAMFIAVCALWQPVPGLVWRVDSPLGWLLIAAQAFGVWVILRSAFMLDVLELSGVRQLSPRPQATEFKTSGPYGWMRHPIYTGWFLLVFCVTTMTMTRFVFAVVSSAYLLVAIPFEERSLLNATGDAYRRYTQAVRWKLIPGVY